MSKLRKEVEGSFIIDYGDYDEEMEGYRDASNFTFENYRGTNESGDIEVEPTMTHEEDDEITMEFDINFDGYTMNEENKAEFYQLRLGSYTGTEGVYLASEDWQESDRETLELMDRLLE
tara:strand:- start:5380 stop:5736 length:357 start_codon:yes stop_codon:yes gene_type:complete